MSLTYTGTWDLSGTAPYDAILVIKSIGDVYVSVDGTQIVTQHGYYSEYAQSGYYTDFCCTRVFNFRWF